ncbi:MAG: hypothetical protein JW940_01995 [Polyangiaceae bacterium]|nr:hypothetical protein [Polyangiaceae bacterium]
MRLRNQLWTLLLARMRRVRTVARHVFRLYPDIAQQATSRYLRRQRAQARRKAQTGRRRRRRRATAGADGLLARAAAPRSTTRRLRCTSLGEELTNEGDDVGSQLVVLTASDEGGDAAPD